MVNTTYRLINMDDIEIRQSAIGYAHDHFSHVYANEESRFVEIEEILEDSQLIYDFLVDGLWEINLYSLDRAFAYHYQRMESGFASPKITEVIETAKKVKLSFG